MPVYIWFIYEAHFYELNSLFKEQVVCVNDKYVDLINIWFVLELRVFYGWILAGIVFLMCA